MNDIEFRLREFRPRRPAPIPDGHLPLPRGPFWLAVAAGLAAAMLIVADMETPTSQQQPPVHGAADIALGALTTMAIERPAEFDAALARMSRLSLPDVRQPGGALQQLAREH
jgi:hypothetical protein